MAERAGSELPYGQFGAIRYASDGRRWLFQRREEAQSGFQVLGKPRVTSYITQTESEDRKAPGGKAAWHSHRLKQQVSNLVRANPDLRLTEGLLAPLLRTSQAVQDTVHQYNANEGALLSFSDHKPAPVAATVSGCSQNEVRFVRMQMLRRGWASSRNTWLEMPTFRGTEAAWSDLALPILQVLFSTQIPSPKLAVRQSTRVTILSLRISSVNSKMSVAKAGQVDITELEGCEFAHVTFNPWSVRQFGTVDEVGNWHIFELKGTCTSVVFEGSLRESAESSDDLPSDGWARIAWLSNPKMVAVCTRKVLKVYDIGADEAVPVADIDLGLSVNAPWILDFEVLPENPEYFVVLTSAHLVLCRLALVGMAQVRASVVLRLRHYRNPDDMNLRLIVSQSGKETIIALFSQRNDIVLIFRMTADKQGQTRFEPPKQLPSQSSVLTERIQGISKVSIMKLKTKTRNHDTGDRRKLSHNEKTPEFYAVTILYKDGNIVQNLLYQVHAGLEAAESQPLTWEKLVGRPFKDRFIVDDSESEDDQRELIREPRSARSRPLREREQKRMRSRNFVELSNELSTSTSTTMNGSLAFMRASLSRLSADEIHGIRTLSSLVPSETHLRDIEDAADALRNLALPSKDIPRMELGSEALDEVNQQLALDEVPPMSLFGTETEQRRPDLAAIYSQLVNYWIVPLSPEVPGLIRVAKDQLARNVAAELALASRTIRVHESQKPEAMQSEENIAAPNIELPIESQASSRSQPSPSDPFNIKYLGLPTPSPTTTPSVTTASSRTILYAPEFDRLRRYAHFTKSAPPALPRSLSNVLAHWTLGGDLDSYDWISTARDLSQRDEEADQEMTEKERQRMQRRAERHLRRQRKEVEASQAQRLASSQVLPLMSASQPSTRQNQAQPATNASSSQQTNPVAPVPASQPIAGKFALRPPPKKKRKQGF